eukprot:CAMPEP_0117747110 /NCGR_PEP_ID=MMETSP0947-20121206/8320_1 /TAXON_ID=44440 /ORGANISM="Chattonella subsalsa, Strain CCMP2191" /LENGTH=541 /DNA_ID=CAMNT_0005564509 /DNA_START=301 /DNA_END=1926 /DNA_ORIENTATION=-
MTDIDDKIIQRGWERGFAGKGWESYGGLARHYENEFLEDMNTLNVMKPHAITRVSEHMQEIINYISTILRNGNAYVVKNSGVYFDVKSLGHSYGRLVAKKGLAGNSADTFGDSLNTMGKKDSRDFALWKTAKENEPFWESPWGYGRPGWHIECSAMTHALFGDALDLHSGGIDLAFPHHTNEMAQCEAHNCSSKWVKYWLHSGHLHIEGLKMSKSLKNFITIREYLQSSSADEFRMFCLQFKYNTNISFSNDRLKEAQKQLSRFEQFLSLSRLHLSELHKASVSIGGTKRWHHADHTLFNKLMDTQNQVLCDLGNDFDTPSAINRLDALMSAVHEHLKHSNKATPPEPVEASVNYISKILESFGLMPNAASNNLQQNQDGQFHSTPSQVIDILASFRTQVRRKALKMKEDKSSMHDLLKLCDDMRDRNLPEIGIELEDISRDRSHWKFSKPSKPSDVPKDKERKPDQTNKQKRQEVMVHPKEMFQHGEYEGKFAAFDDEGFPTLDISMEKISKSQIKKLKKKAERYFKRYQRFLEKQEDKI